MEENQIKCNYCREMISSKATFCPHCTNRTKYGRLKKLKYNLTIDLIVILIIVIFYIWVRS